MFTAVGLTVLFYDHVLTFADEVRLVWLAPRSLAKYAFLFNRYLVLGTLLCVACGTRRNTLSPSDHLTNDLLAELCGFVGDVFTDTVRVQPLRLSTSGGVY